MFNFEKIATIRPVPSRAVGESKIGLGFEKLDRDIFEERVIGGRFIFGCSRIVRERCHPGAGAHDRRGTAAATAAAGPDVRRG